MKGEPPKSMRQHANRDRPPQHSQRCREEDTEGSNSEGSSYRIEPQRNRPTGCFHRQTYTEKCKSNEEPAGNGQNHEAGVNESTGAEAYACADQVEHALKNVRPWHQNHARTNS